MNLKQKRKVHLREIKEAVKLQSYSFLLGVAVSLLYYSNLAETKRKAYFEYYKDLLGKLSIPFDVLTINNKEDVYLFIKQKLGDEYYKSDFFVSGFFCGILTSYNAPDIKPLLNDTDKEIMQKFRHTTEKVLFYNHPIINDGLFDKFYSLCYQGMEEEAVELLWSVKGKLEDWINNNLLN